MEQRNLHQMLASYPAPGHADIQTELDAALPLQPRVIVVLDDDPTGIQTVHGVPVFTDWAEQSLEEGFREGGMFFILTNSRGMSEGQARETNRTIAERLLRVSRRLGRDYILVSRGDSTLRGYYPLETAVLAETTAQCGGAAFDGEIICPFFLEGGRYTAENIHYVLYGDALVPAGDTEFARDKSFGYTQSDLTGWVEEKTRGAYSRKDVLSVSIAMLRSANGADAVCRLLMEGKDFCKVVVNALCYDDIRVFCTGYIRAANQGKRYLIRSGAAIPKILGGITDQPLLAREQLVTGSGHGGLVVIGSHVAKATQQLESLRQVPGLAFIEFDQHLVMEPHAFRQERDRVKKACNASITQGKDTVLYTRRERLDVNTGDPDEELRLSRSISDAVTDFVTGLEVQPAYIIAKGGITSSDIGTTALRVRKATVLGQILPGVPVWKTGGESKFPNMAYIIFPGNVGESESLKIIVEKLRQ